MHATARVPLAHGEQLQFAEYRAGEKYEFHSDADPDVPRVATMILYLSDAEGTARRGARACRVRRGLWSRPCNRDACAK